jgi:alpha-D-ribose 1-methylphosphonate 5-triphosphate synthase subunit PhnG
MTRKERTEILAICGLETLKNLSMVITKTHTVKILEEPSGGLVMIKMRESAMKHLFYLGEVFVTECKVMIDEVIGLGIIQGSHPQKAYHLAIIDAAYNSELEAVNKLDHMIQEIGEHHREKEKKVVANVLKTKVDFITLDEEVKS